MFKGKLIVLVGPTASGKTDLAIELAKHYNTVIISADSRQFYREIPIGTAAPTNKQLKEVKHFFIGNLSIIEEYNVSKFEHDVLALLNSQLSNSDIVIMTGGSGLYIDAVCKGIDELPDIDEKIREDLKRLYDTNGLETLQNRLKELDPEYFQVVDLNNPIRLMRALEVCIQTGKKYSDLRKDKPAKRDFAVTKLGISIERELLVERVNIRTDRMMEEGWLEEAKKVIAFRKSNSLNTVGYKELYSYLDGDYTLEYAIEKIKTNTRRYAKRQMTWFRRDKEIYWFRPDELDKMIDLVDSQP